LLAFRSGWLVIVVLIWLVTLYLLFAYAQSISERDAERLLGADYKPLWSTQLAVACVLLIIGWSLGFCIRRAIQETKKQVVLVRENSNPWLNSSNVASPYFLALIAAIVYCLAFMSLLYPSIPEQFGGGKPQEVRLVIDEDARRGLQEAGLSLDSKRQQLSVPLELVHETDKIYVIRLPDGRIIRIDKSLVSAVIAKD
jgi:hypothetical protein